MRKTVLLLASSLLLAAFCWFALVKRSGLSVAADLTPRGTAGERAQSALQENLVALANEPEGSSPDRRTVREADEAVRETAADAPAVAEEEGTHTFVGRLVLPDREPLEVARVQASLTEKGGLEHLFEGRDCKTIQFEHIRRGVYDLRVAVDGYRHRTETLDLRSGQGDERVTLWPKLWIPIIIRTRDGRPFRALAEDLNLEPKRLFVHAFRVEASRDPFSADAPPTTMELDSAQALARFRPAPGYQNVELPGSIACSLELLSEPPMWVGLWVHGVFQEAQVLQLYDEELVFEIDMDVIDASFASVSMRLVDRESGSPVVDARATLKADTSAHRRGDLSDVAPTEAGLLLFKRVIPGQHELTILRAGSLVQRRVRLASGQHLDLGDIPIGAGPGLRLRVVDIHGQGVSSSMEIAPLERGERADDLYPPNLHRSTDDEGVYMMPIPDCISIVRARLMVYPAGYSKICSRNFLIDPAELPAELVILAQDPVDLSVEPMSPWIAGERLTCEDEYGVIVDSAQGEDAEHLEVDLVPGTYLVRRWKGEREVGRLDVLIRTDSKVMRCP